MLFHQIMFTQAMIKTLYKLVDPLSTGENVQVNMSSDFKLQHDIQKTDNLMKIEPGPSAQLELKEQVKGKKYDTGCNKCDFVPLHRQSLSEHIRTHTGERPYPCSMCQYKARTKHALIVHTRTHSGERPYQCDLCDYATTQSSALSTHKRIHTGERPYSCSSCEYKARTKHAIVVHMRTHSGEKPYQCNLCEYRGTQKSTLNSHITRMHRKDGLKFGNLPSGESPGFG